jgi:putative transposase
VDCLFGEWGVTRDNRAGRCRFEQGMEERKAQETQQKEDSWKQLRRGWFLGEESFRQELLALIREEQAEHHYGEELAESVEQQAEQLISQMLRAIGWSEQELVKHRKGDKAKLKMAAKLRTHTTISWKWIAEKLHMGHWRSAANAVRLHLPTGQGA